MIEMNSEKYIAGVKRMFFKKKKKDTSIKKKYIQVQFQKEGIHCFPGADSPKFSTGGWDDVSFLKFPHMHYFHFRVTIEVNSNDREIEFIQFRRWLERLYDEKTLQLNNKSCEMIGEELLNKIEKKYPNRYVKIEVFEDNINGGIVEYYPPKN
jgi:hypothetical protein